MCHVTLAHPTTQFGGVHPTRCDFCHAARGMNRFLRAFDFALGHQDDGPAKLLTSAVPLVTSFGCQKDGSKSCAVNQGLN